MTFEERKAAISNALIDRQGLQHIIDVAAEVLNNPIFVLDLSMKFVSLSQRIPVDYTDWDELVKDDGILQKVRIIENAGVYDHLLHNDEPIFGKFDFYPKRYLGCRVRDKTGPVGIVCVIEDNPLGQSDEELVIHLCKTLFYQVIYTGTTASHEVPAYGLLRDLIEQNISSADAEMRAASIHLKIPEKMCVLMVEYEERKIGLTIYRLHKAIDAALPLDYVIILQGSHYCAYGP